MERAGTKVAGLDTGSSEGGAIISAMAGDATRSLRISRRLFEQGINVRPIVYPAVAEWAARLRFFVTGFCIRPRTFNLQCRRPPPLSTPFVDRVHQVKILR